MIKRYYKCFTIIMIFVLILSACNTEINTSKDSSQVTVDHVKIRGGKTIKEAMDYYVDHIESSMGLTGAFYTGKYKIIDTEETSDRISVYACIVSRWVDISGSTVSSGSGVYSIGFRKENNVYVYEDFQAYKATVTPYVPQKVSEIISNEGMKIFDGLIVEIEKDIEEYLNP